jgi:hypothetical protein
MALQHRVARHAGLELPNVLSPYYHYEVDLPLNAASEAV